MAGLIENRVSAAAGQSSELSPIYRASPHIMSQGSGPTGWSLWTQHDPQISAYRLARNECRYL